MRVMLSFAIICSGCLGSATPSATTSGGGNDASVAPSAPIATTTPSGADGGVAAIADDFEGAALDSRWTIVGAEGHQQPQPTTAVLDTSRAHSGKQSLHIYDGFIETAPPSTSFYARAWVWLGSDPGSGHWMAWVGVGASTAGGAQGTEVRYGGHYDILQANYFGNDDEVISDPKGYCSPTCTNGVAAPVGRWSCVEVYFGANEIRFWLDGSEIPTLHVTAWPHQAAPWSPAYDLVRLGFHDFQGSAIDIWYDDVALGSSRLGCGG